LCCPTRRADADLAWENLEKLYETGETLEAKVVQVVKGGLLVNVGVRGFIPASHVSPWFSRQLGAICWSDARTENH